MTGSSFWSTKLSDEFLRVATKEIKDELEHIDILLNSCGSDSDVAKYSNELEAHFHKIKGLSPMMGKKIMGKVSEMIDSILKNIVEGKNIEGMHEILIESNKCMKDDMNDLFTKYENLENKIKDRYSNFL